jgi:long-chain acyl-CoA synthetase
MMQKNKYSVELPDTSTSDTGGIRRGDALTNPELGVEGVQTLYEGLRRGLAINPLGSCLGFRAMSSNGFPTPYIYSCYTECVARVDAFAAGLDCLDLVEKNPDGMILLGIYMRNCMEWVLAEHGIYCLSGATVPLYDTLGPNTVKFILAQTGTKSVVCSRAELKALCEAKESGECPFFTHAILVDGITPQAAEMACAAALQVISFAKVEATGSQLITTKGHKHSPPSRGDVMTFCYTSGTTGDPKGALITHENIVSHIAGMKSVFRAQLYDRHLSYLPLPHIFERVVLPAVLMAGGSVAFYRGNPLWLIEDLQACRPTVMPVAPRVLNKIYDKIQNGMIAAGGVKKKLFDAALKAKARNLRHGQLTHAFYDKLIFNKIKKALGMDHLRFMVSGSAPLSENVMVFFRCMLGIPVVEGYGQTEGAATATIGRLDDMATVGHVGGPTPCVEILLADVPEMGYLHTDTNHRGQPCQGRGEIWVRGPNVFKGYYKDPDNTRETVDDKGWLHSGDIGLWTMDGNLQIIDRKKNIFKLSQGEYVAPEKIENILIRSPLIAQSFVHGDSFQSCLVAVIVPDEEPVLAWAKASADGTLKNLSFEQLCRSEVLSGELMSEVLKLSKENGLHGFETVRAIHVEPKPFTTENDLVTPTFKLKRQKARDYYEKEIVDMYASVPPPKSKL